MSKDYSRAFQAISGVCTAPTANLVLGYYFSKTFDYMVLHLQVLVLVQATDADNEIRIQKGTSAGAFGAVTTLASIDPISNGVAGSSNEVRVADDDAEVSAGYGIRLIHIDADATLSFWYSVAATPVHD